MTYCGAVVALPRTIVTYCALSGTTAAQNQLLILLVSGDPELPPPRHLPGPSVSPQRVTHIGVLGTQLGLSLQKRAPTDLARSSLLSL